MKINGIHRVGGTNPYSRSQESKAADLSGKRPKPKDEVRISTEAQELLEAQGAAETERARKLSELKQSVSAGTYHVDARKLAEKLLPYLK